MNKEEQDIKSVVEQTIREEVPRIIRQLTIGIRVPYLGALGQGCCADQGCCRNYGCCRDQGCCIDKRGIMALIADRPDCMEAYIISHKEEVRKFFQERGIELKF